MREKLCDTIGSYLETKAIYGTSHLFNFTIKYKFALQLRSRQADEYRNLEEDYRQRHQRLHESHELEIQNCIRRYFAKNNQEQPEDLSLHRPQDSAHNPFLQVKMNM